MFMVRSVKKVVRKSKRAEKNVKRIPFYQIHHDSQLMHNFYRTQLGVTYVKLCVDKFDIIIEY